VEGDRTTNLEDAMPAATPYAAIHETHAAVVLLLGDRAYKFKKPVELGVLDFTELADRQAVCRREVELNRRMSPDVYLGVSQLHQPDGTSEPVVTMRRMDPAERLSTLVRSGVPVADELRELARQLAALHLRSAHNGEIDREGSAERLLERWSDSFEVVRRHAGVVVDAVAVAEIETLVRRYLAGRGDLFAERIRTGCIVDGHGDLVADDIYCTPEGTRALDCLEFDDRLRYLDQIDDAAFLAMDLERLGAAELGRRLLAWYREFAGDNAPPSLVAHYLAYRAFVRVKVECVRHDQGDPEAAARAQRLAEIALDHLREHAVTLTLVGGAPGTGKSTVAGALADRFGLTLVSSDRVRKEQAGLAPERRSAASWQQGLYSPAWTRVTYNGIVDRAAALLRRGESVVLDATWSDQAQRAAARDVARGAHAELLELRTVCDPALAEARITNRHGPSDANADVAARIRRQQDPWPQALELDTAEPLEHVVALAAESYLNRSGPGHRMSAMAPD